MNEVTRREGRSGMLRAAKAGLDPMMQEVLLAGGWLDTPLFRERSGIGDPAQLRSAGVKVVVDSPNVAVSNSHTEAESELFDWLKAPVGGVGVGEGIVIRLPGCRFVAPDRVLAPDEVPAVEVVSGVGRLREYLHELTDAKNTASQITDSFLVKGWRLAGATRMPRMNQTRSQPCCGQ
ncbi:GMC family oxidoreductase N-terminal domain-containing protein [Cryobacterium ruanii]|uniref:GMC family oxidoreductase N-terminal domain-containing protein n=1 Tax=Cryobacterium ruanii TaxID=1259197 RepID=UPI001581C841